MNRIRAIFTREVRAWIYGVMLALGAVAVTYGIVTTDELASWVALGAAVLIPNGLAMANLGNDRRDDPR